MERSTIFKSYFDITRGYMILKSQFTSKSQLNPGFLRFLAKKTTGSQTSIRMSSRSSHSFLGRDGFLSWWHHQQKSLLEIRTKPIIFSGEIMAWGPPGDRIFGTSLGFDVFWWDGCCWGIGWRYLHFPRILMILTVENLPVDGNCSKKSSRGYFGNVTWLVLVKMFRDGKNKSSISSFIGI